MNNTCRLLSNGYKFEIDNTNQRLMYRPCCYFTGSTMYADQPTEQQQKYRQELNQLNSYESSTCATCNRLENLSLKKTFRQTAVEFVPDTAEIGDASYLEIQIDRTCNGGCIICGPWHSSYWQNQEKQFIPIKHKTDYIAQILEVIDIQKVRKINFLGGEPFLTDVDTQIIGLIKQPELVKLKYTTNGSIFPGLHRLEHWKNFNEVVLNFSIDGVGPQFEYIRYPLDWNTVTSNIFQIDHRATDNVKFKINHTVNLLNIYYYNEFEHWHQNLQSVLNRQLIDHTFSPAIGTLSPLHLNARLKNLIYQKYNKDEGPVKLINSVDPGANRQAFKKVIDYLSLLDKHRGLNWKMIFPEVASVIN